MRHMRGVTVRGRNKNVFSRPNLLRENAETAISGRGPGPARKKRYTSSREGEEDTQMCPWGKEIESRTRKWENVTCTRRNGAC